MLLWHLNFPNSITPPTIYNKEPLNWIVCAVASSSSSPNSLLPENWGSHNRQQQPKTKWTNLEPGNPSANFWRLMNTIISGCKRTLGSEIVPIPSWAEIQSDTPFAHQHRETPRLNTKHHSACAQLDKMRVIPFNTGKNRQIKTHYQWPSSRCLGSIAKSKTVIKKMYFLQKSVPHCNEKRNSARAQNSDLETAVICGRNERRYEQVTEGGPWEQKCLYRSIKTIQNVKMEFNK